MSSVTAVASWGRCLDGGVVLVASSSSAGIVSSGVPGPTSVGSSRVEVMSVAVNGAPSTSSAVGGLVSFSDISLILSVIAAGRSFLVVSGDGSCAMSVGALGSRLSDSSTSVSRGAVVIAAVGCIPCRDRRSFVWGEYVVSLGLYRANVRCRCFRFWLFWGFLMVVYFGGRVVLLLLILRSRRVLLRWGVLPELWALGRGVLFGLSVLRGFIF